MMRKTLCAAALCTATLAQATPLEITYTAVVTRSTGGSGLPALGDTLSGRVVFDDTEGAYSPCTSPPQPPGYQSRCLAGAPYGSSFQAPGAAAGSSSLALEVFDNDLSLIGISTPGDLITFSARQVGLFYSLQFLGPEGSFAGTALPTPALLQTLAAGATLSGIDLAASGGAQSFDATVTTFAVSVVPEPATALSLLLGLAWLGGAAHLQRGRQRGGPDQASSGSSSSNPSTTSR
jgi:hypothetical protein